jgi:hypothetical protein
MALGENSSIPGEGTRGTWHERDRLVRAVLVAAWLAEKNTFWTRRMKAWFEYMKNDARNSFRYLAMGG